MRYREDERDQYEPPPCPVCGGPADVNWVDVTQYGDPPEAHYAIPGQLSCPNDPDEAHRTYWARVRSTARR